MIKYKVQLTLTILLVTSISFGQKKIEKFQEKHPDPKEKSKSIGSVSNGSLKNGKLFPYEGDNFFYFDSSSYLRGRAFIHGTLRKVLLKTYASLLKYYPDRKFGVMEIANKEGGKIAPHRTHQMGTSVDFMMPIIDNSGINTSLDHTGTNHYWLAFNDKGEYKKNTDLKVDFNTVAHHTLLLDETARKHGYHVKKVIIKIEFKEHLFKTEYGKKLKNSDIYIVRGLTPLINALHDDHYHIDFEPLE